MRLRPLEPVSRTAQHIAGISSRLKLDVLAYRPPVEPRALIILGDGTPDDYIMALVAWACDGRETALVVKPPTTGVRSAVEKLRDVYLPGARSLQYIVLVVDRDQRSLTQIKNEAQGALRDYAFRILSEREHVDGWLKEFSCEWRLGREVRILVLVNGLGLDDLYVRDTAEVHLLEVAKEVLDRNVVLACLEKARFESDEKRRVEPKKAWSLLSRSQQWEVFRSIKDRLEQLKRLFRQHFAALEMCY